MTKTPASNRQSAGQIDNNITSKTPQKAQANLTTRKSSRIQALSKPEQSKVQLQRPESTKQTPRGSPQKQPRA